MTVTVAPTEDLETCLNLRRIVFMDEQGVSEAEEIDGLDEDCLHLLAREGDLPVGTARVYFDQDIAKIGRVCVLKSHRGTGLGAALIRAALAASEGRAVRAKLGAQTHALGFYRTLGFIPVGPVYDDAGIPHRDMVRAL
ncbi:putative N-acetyltransferase YjcF [Sulfitobacter sp. THAF37]|uniref:GNAT family N-acetyltransferase n=1 Tax=Sulfitobacter sp. THAF37 TaxID=2587855 RepID=UPI0012683736|nr:GNAT family N-acetyltransferase [Sulfitobacter sp. THAF37]QFT58341.1 putative N-acetyltransferase YjcF [Sulfitobacter sp. THAF37]